MATYIAFLRGINVGAHNRMKMNDLWALVESLGFDDVETYIQSGNVIFESADGEETELRATIHDAIEDEFGYDITVMIRTQAELSEIVAGQPFDISGTKGIKHYVTFLDEEPTNEQLDALLAAESDAEQFEIRGREVYSELDKEALGNGRFTDVGKTLGMTATRRTWDVVTAIEERVSA
ncbi:DUF1697 domain-containing protein [Haladaptatus caseinilyticus]|uniref:DUF1697 domain-containing protein n=1 Tax=Haladaptatus caseinilyticus TaxID=2993314 RepID=UPI00224B875C|nr:DUF1697 domain-containing protein [Haladaptatus caseinilyticus]